MMQSNRSVSLVLRLSAAATLVIGLITLLIPGTVISLFDGYQADNFHFVRFIGTALIGFSVMNWICSTFSDMKPVLPVLYGNVASLVLAIGVDVSGLITGMLSATAWLLVVLHVVFAAGFIYCIKLITSST